MKLTILGSGGCMTIPKPLCRCRTCREARKKGVPYARTGSSAFVHDINLLIDTPAETASQLNRSGIRRVDYLILTHLDPDHVEGLRIVEQITLDFRTWRAYPEKQICLLLPEVLSKRLGRIQSQYGPLVEAYEKRGFIRLEPFRDGVRVGPVTIDAIPVDRGEQIAFVYVFEKGERRIVYAPCDVKPFPEHRTEVQRPDLLVIQPGIFETGLRHRFRYPEDHISRTTLYTFEQTLELAARIQAKKILFVHLEEYWHRSYDDYCALESDRVRFAYDGMQVEV
ncbi:MAG: MBL fold metallo-hydrolase [Dehalococcoidia bacterium]|nr:MBL fold metallo-hydrolase [Dehalococcoidia bacterium]